MKKFLTVFIAVISAMIFTNCAKDEKIPGEDLPFEIRAYTKTHFPDQIIKVTLKDLENYEVTLDNATKLKFNLDYKIIDIEGLTRLPDSVIPFKILLYVANNYPDNFIMGWEIDDINQKIELNNEVDLKFDGNGDFLMID
jgi:ABC-type antimicrobial peptide transport system permease subunit